MMQACAVNFAVPFPFALGTGPRHLVSLCFFSRTYLDSPVIVIYALSHSRRQRDQALKRMTQSK